MTTIESITTRQIDELRRAARDHGDEKMVDVCDEALLEQHRAAEASGWELPMPATRECVRVLNESEEG